MSSPVGRVVAKIPPRTRRGIQIGITVADVLATVAAPHNTTWQRRRLGIKVLDTLWYEFDAVADDDDVKGDSISATNRWVYDKVAAVIGEKPTAALWTLALERLATWYTGHIMKRVVESVSN